MSAYLDKPYCPNKVCVNYGVPLATHKKLYHEFGQAKSGAKRYRCKACNKTFSTGPPGNPTKHQEKPYKNAQVFRGLVNSVAFNRLSETADISPSTLYHKIDFIHRQCMAFVADREKYLPNKKIRRLYIGVDRQEYTINWSSRNDRRNSSMWSIASADNETGYVFGVHLNYDPSEDPVEVEKGAGTYEAWSPFRKHARLWLMRDYSESVKQSRLKAGMVTGKKTWIRTRYDEMAARQDIEAPDEFTDDVILPVNGMQVHAEYTIYAHFTLLKRLFQRVGKVRFFLDQDSGMRAACLAAFHDRIKKDRCDAFYVRINSELSIDEKRRAVNEARNRFNKVKAANPGFEDWQVRLHILLENMAQVAPYGRWQDKWISHPFPNMSEPAKAMCYLTDIHEDYTEDHKAWLYNKASLHAVDRFFMMARRRIRLLERPGVSASYTRHKFFIYSPYNPAMVAKLLDIFRVWHNYIFLTPDRDDKKKWESPEDKGLQKRNKDTEQQENRKELKRKRTPAMRLGLAQGPVKFEDIIYYTPQPSTQYQARIQEATGSPDPSPSPRSN